jgi:t-SNARE complex subunit (syntaxin)
MTTKKETTGVYALAQKVLNLLNIGEDAKINNFFSKEVKKAEKFIRDLKRNLTTLENTYNDDVDDINEKLVDAREAVEDAKIAVTLADVKTNDAADSFASVYWRNVDAKLAEVKRLEKKLETLAETFKKDSEDVQEQIEKYQARIDMIKG